MLKSVHWFRGIAIIFVVLSHVPLTGLETVPGGKLFGAIVKNGTYFFVFIAGFLFFYLIDKFNLRKFVFSKLKNVILPYSIILTSIMIVITVFHNLNISFFNYYVTWSRALSENGFLTHLLVGGSLVDALWYIPMAAIFFIISPALGFVYRNYTALFYLIGSLLLVVSLTSFRPYPNIYPLYSFSHFVGIYLLGGMVAKNFPFILKNHFLIFILALCGLFVSLYFHSTQLNLRYAWFYGGGELALNLIQLQKTFFTFAILTALIRLDQKSLSLDWLSNVANYSFGIFFIHGILISLLRNLSVWDRIDNQYAKFCILFATVFLCSYILVFVIKMILGRKSKMVIGS